MVKTETKVYCKTRNKSSSYFEALQYRQDLLPKIHYQKRTHFPIVQKITIIRVQRIGNPRFEIWYSVVAPSGGLNRGAQLQIIPYKKPPKHF